MPAFFLMGWMGRFYEPLGASAYFLLTATLPVAGAIVLIVFAKPLERLLAAGDSNVAITYNTELVTA